MVFTWVNFKIAVVALVKISDSTARNKIFVFMADELGTSDLERWLEDNSFPGGGIFSFGSCKSSQALEMLVL